MKWNAVVPMKSGEARKSRLAPALPPDQRAKLGDQMARHVIACLGRVASIDRILIVSKEPAMEFGVDWVPDQGLGLNAELARVRAALAPAPVLVIHADLPLLDAADVDALLLAAAASGAAIAPDRHGTGTNAIAIADGRPLDFYFGSDSFSRHCRALGADAAVIRRHGLALDIDTPDDLALAGIDHGAAL
jgi:2-phospho-L-lactate guanylyltransferase